MKKRKPLHGFLADEDNPVSMEEIVKELREDRKECDRGTEESYRIARAWKKYRLENNTPNNFDEYLKFIRSKIS